MSLNVQDLGMEVCYSDTGRKLPDHVPDECHMVFVCADFSGPDYDRLVEKKFRFTHYKSGFHLEGGGGEFAPPPPQSSEFHVVHPPYPYFLKGRPANICSSKIAYTSACRWSTNIFCWVYCMHVFVLHERPQLQSVV